MNTNNDDHDEEILQDVFASLGKDAPSPDPAFRRRLYAQSLAAFQASSPSAERETQTSDDQAGGGKGPAGRRSTRSSRLIVLAWRGGIATAAAAVIVVFVWFLASPHPAAAQPTLAAALEKLADSKTVHLRIAQPDKTAEAWFSQPGRLRKNDPDGTYLIARDNKAWQVDEKANQAASRSVAFLHGDKPRLDALALLELGESKDLPAALGKPAVERAQRDGVACLIYRADITLPRGPARLEAVVDAATLLLRSLEITVDRDGKVTPVATLTVLDVNQPVGEDLFIVGDSLTEDGRIGKLVDAQGIVSVKPVMAARWTPVSEGMILKPGDWVQTDVRGANAAAVRLAGQAELVVGPGSLVELATPQRIRLADGEIKLVGAQKAPIQLLGPGDQKAQVTDRSVYRVQNEKLVRLDKDPPWLKGFEGREVNDAIGSLVAKIDGRNVPLTVGYHKVTVDIRDQIARTVVEESFANHTDARLEGVFYFPLPQDASISGFGMWIGQELVEADIVEKQRAREIYEQILRERRDPGLLEWSGGNLFKARVFPIEAHSEKRIKISYTQVLPMRGSAYRYSYSLQSEMLKLHPLRELQLDVKINSTLPLKSVACPTHTARIDQTKNSAHVEFAAQEYTPTRDFEVAVEADSKGADVVLVPHRRGEDGYFMLLLSPPPGQGGAWQRDILPDTPADPPQELLILADTSASMDPSQRAAQAEFIAALLTALRPTDTFNLAACDVDCDWVFDKSVTPEANRIAAARDFLGARDSLGWSDLDKAFASAQGRCGPRTSVVYVGDGIVTTGQADPVAFAQRLKRLHEGKQGTFYAVSAGSLYESGVLKAIASLGGGSVRQISGEHGPRAAALELLGETARPPLRDLKVQFKGIRTARVYPQELPNLPEGSQQILLGRYLPEGADQSGEVIVTGTRAGQPVRYSSPVSLKDAEQGNSFIPRLWARLHLDMLLAQGAGPAIQDEIVALSEEYHIMTPYTSLLVLESDADRERFKVQRRFLMRDGEKFFAQGRDNANYDLLQQQMKRAGAWRIGLRRAVLGQFGNLGRDPRIFQEQYRLGPRVESWGGFGKTGSSFTYATSGGSGGSGSYKDALDVTDLFLGDNSEPGRYNGARDLGERSWLESGDRSPTPTAIPGESEIENLDFKGDLGVEEDIRYLPTGNDRIWSSSEDILVLGGDLDAGAKTAMMPPSSSFQHMSFLGDDRDNSLLALRKPSGSIADPYNAYWRDHSPVEYPYTQWLSTLFPPLPSAAKEPPALAQRWPAEARAISDSLLRKDALAALKDGLVVDHQVDSFDTQADQLDDRNRSLWLVSAKSWLVRNEYDGQQTTIQWCDGKQRAVFNGGFLLGRARAAKPEDLQNPPLDFGYYAFSSLERSYSTWKVELKPQGDSRVLLVLVNPGYPASDVRILVDTARHVVLSLEQLTDGKVTSTQKLSEFVELGGAWWPGRIESLDDKGRRLSLTTEKLTPAMAADFDRQFQAQLADTPKVQFIAEPGRKLPDAKRSFELGKADFDDHLTMLLHFARSQQWDRVMEYLSAAEKLAGDKPGMRWVRDAMLQISRKHEDLKTHLLARAAELAKTPTPSREDLPLAQYMLAQAGEILENNEELAMLDGLKPVFERQPAHVQGLKQWNSQRVNLLQQVGRNEEALTLTKQMAEKFGRDCSLQLQYAQGLVNAGRLEDAYAWLDKALAGTQWLPRNEEFLRGRYADMLFNEGRYEDLLAWTQKWMSRELDDTGAYGWRLSSLIRMSREADAGDLIAQWLKDGQSPQRLPGPVAGRLNAAVAQALGQGYNMYSQRIEEQWLAPLADTALALARHPSHASVADTIMDNGRFNRTDQARRVRTAAVAMLQADIDKLTPQEVQRLVGWAMTNDPAIEIDVWKRIASALHKRWSATAQPQDKYALGQTLVQIHANRLDPADYLAFLREQLKDGPATYRSQYAGQLFSALIAQPWDSKLEDEALGMIEQLSDAQEAPERLLSAVRALHTFDDRMVQARYDAKMKALTHPEELPRTELKAKQAENLRLARVELADRLARDLPNRGGGIVKWFALERLYLDVLAGRDLAKAAGECWEIAGERPQMLDLDEHPQLLLEAVLRERALVMLANLACRKDAAPALIDQLITYIDRGIALDQDDPQWKLMKYELLVGLDRPKDLEQALAGWTRGEDPDNRWKVALGYLLAEQGKLVDAIKLFEAVSAADELGPSEHRVLADWYMAIDRRDSYRQAMIATYKLTQEWLLSHSLYSRLRPWQQSDGKPPAELDEQVLLIFAALFEKSAAPQNHLGLLREYYMATRDFRLLSGMADAVVGHTAGQVYPFLQGAGSVLSEVRDEATADSIVECLVKVRQRAKTEIDQRALDLLETLTQRRGAELLNQPGPHGDKAVAALQRAFKRTWSPGEPRLMADLLASMDMIAYKPLAQEQVSQAESLHRDSEKGSEDRLHIARQLAIIYWSYQRHENAIDLLTNALDEFQSPRGGILPQSANDALETLVSYLEQRSRFARGETVLLEQLQHPVHTQQKFWLTQRLYSLYVNAVRSGGEVSLGTGQALYQAAQEKLLADLPTHDQNHRYALVCRLCDLYRAAHDRRLAGVISDLQAFAFKVVPGVLKGQTSNYDAIVGVVSGTLHEVAGPRDALAFLIERTEQEPAWFRWNNQDGWSRHGYELADLRSKVADLGDLEPRLLKIVLAELKWDLRTGVSRNRNMYHHQNNDYWAAKADDFLQAAEEVYAERKNSGAAVAYIAEYLYWGLNRYDRAIEILLVAHKDKRLDEPGQWQLVRYLHDQKRYGESVDLLQAMIEWRPDNMEYRTALTLAYYHTQRQAELTGLLDQTDEHFHKDGRWTEPAMAALGQACLDTALYEQSVKYYKELIPLHQRTQPNRGIGNGTLSQYYGNMGLAYAGLGKTAEAVDAACGAIISWGPTHHNRADAIRALLNVVRQAPRLDEYVAQLDQQAAEGGLDNPIVRKAVGQVYLEKKDFAKAFAQLTLACQLQPNDLEIHQALIACCDAQKDNDGAIRQLLRSLQLMRRDISLYCDLGKRYADLGRTKEAERAYTSIVEVLPSESESHQKLAEVRQEQGRWPEAIEQWEQVARLRALEPTGLLKLGEAQVRLERWDDLAETIRKLRAKGWPSRFNDVDSQIRELERKLDQTRSREKKQAA